VRFRLLLVVLLLLLLLLLLALLLLLVLLLLIALLLFVRLLLALVLLVLLLLVALLVLLTLLVSLFRHHTTPVGCYRRTAIFGLRLPAPCQRAQHPPVPGPHNAPAQAGGTLALHIAWLALVSPAKRHPRERAGAFLLPRERAGCASEGEDG
jgi:hypothetical protein